MEDKVLSQLKNGEEAEIVSFDGGLGMHQRLKVLGLSPGKVVQKISGLKFGGPTVLLIDRAQVAVGFGMASRIIVRVK